MVERVPFDEAEYQRWLAHAEHTLAAARECARQIVDVVVQEKGRHV